MSKNKRKERRMIPIELGLTASTVKRAAASQAGEASDTAHSIESSQMSRIGWWSYIKQPSHWWIIGLILLLTLGAMGAGLRYLEDSAREQKATGRNSPSGQDTSLLNSVNPFVEPPLPTATPQLSKEYIYAGSRMLAVEDANASAAPPSDLAVWRPSTGYWYVLGGQGSAQTSFQWGAAEDAPVPGDYDGDGKTDFSVFRPSNGTWYVSNSSNGYTIELLYGQSGDTPAPADFDGDGRTDMAVFRADNTAQTGTWYITKSSTQSGSVQQFGLSTDKPAPADYDGDGKADLAVWRPSNQTFYVLRSSDGTLQGAQVGLANSDVPVSADYDGDGKADFAVRHNADWIIKQSSDGVTNTIAWQFATDKEVQNDYDGDGKVDIAVWRDAIGYWLIRQSSHIGQSNELRQVQWGSAGDVPVPAFYRR